MAQPKPHAEHSPFENFERAMNTKPHGRELVGDPERWGDVQTSQILIPAAQAPGLQSIPFSKQLVRAQSPDLYARQWIVYANYSFVVPSGSTASLASLLAEIRTGVGQATFKLAAQVFPGSNVQTPFSLAAGGSGGTVMLGEIPAVAIAIRFHGAVTIPVSVNPSLCHLSVGAFVAPRAL